MGLYLDDLYKSSNSLIRIEGPAAVTAFLVEDTFKISGGANYESKYDKLLDSIIGSSDAAQFITDTAKNFAGYQLKNMESTTLEYTDSERPSLDVNITVVAYSAATERNPLNFVRDFGGCVYPDQAGVAVLNPPNGYIMQDRTKGRFTVSIGKWFTAMFQVLKNFDFQVSKETTPGGYPLYVTATLNFEADRLITKNDYRERFRL